MTSRKRNERNNSRVRRTSVWMALLVAIAAMATASYAAETVKLVRLRCEYKTNPVGIDVMQPRLSWELVSTERGTMQSAYEVRVADSAADLTRKLVWDSGKQNSEQSTQVAYGGPALQSGKRYYWQVQVWDNHEHSSGWSEAAYWEMGLLQASDWKAKWIQPNLEEDPAKSDPSPILRVEFESKSNVASARLYASAMGLYEMAINGKRVGDQYFTPGWTEYDARYQYQTFDVTGLVKGGKNCLAATLGDGWYRGFLAWDNNRNSWGSKLGLLAQLVITYKDGKQEIVATR